MSKINNKNSTIKRVLLQIRPYLPTIILLLALAVVSVLCSLYIPVLVGDAIDAIIGKEQVNFAVILPKPLKKFTVCRFLTSTHTKPATSFPASLPMLTSLQTAF